MESQGKQLCTTRLATHVRFKYNEFNHSSLILENKANL